MNNPKIALDADGVLLNFHEAYRQAWYRAFNELPVLKDPNAYWPIDRWQVRRLAGEELLYFRSFFGDEFWGNIPAIEGAVKACTDLQDAGYELICVSALESRFQKLRLLNLRQEGFPIARVIATDNSDSGISPKASAIHELQPIVFVDDFLPYHRGISKDIHKALVTREKNGSPNVGEELKLIDSSHQDLAGFAQWWISNNPIRTS